MDDPHIQRWRRLKALKAASLVVAGALALVCAALLVVSRLTVPEEDLPDVVTLPDERLAVRNFSYSSPGAHPWELSASSGVVSEALDRVKVTEPKVFYLGPQGQNVMLDAAEGEVDRKTGDVTAGGGVTIKYAGFTFNTTDLRYSQKELTAVTTSVVSLRGDSLLLSGKSLRLTLEPQQIVVEEDVEARLYNVKWTEPGRRLPL